MKVFVFLVIFFLGLVSASELLQQKLFRPTDAYRVYESDFIVMLDGASTDDLYDHIGSLNTAKSHKIHRTYESFEHFKGYAVSIDDLTLLEEIAADPRVTLIEHDQEMRAQQACTVQNDATWGLDRISVQNPDLNGQYHYQTYQDSGRDTISIVIDTGIYVKHNEFTGRAFWGDNFADTVNDDCNGHGTHVAGTIGGTKYGVNKNTQLWAVKVLACNGSGSNSGVIAGVDWAVKKSGQRKVANMSLGGGKSTALNNAVNSAVSNGVVFVVAAGNDNADACNYSPASAVAPITVGATDLGNSGGTRQEDIRSAFSNYGTCVDILAPGSSITSAWIGSPTAVRIISGTSMASPHVAGAAVQYWEENPQASSAAVSTAVVSGATLGKIDMMCSRTACNNTPNKILYSAC